jgi:CBS domain-containing protein
MSPRAAWRLEELGFGEVNEYEAGKLDWMSAGLPFEGRNAERPRAGTVARTDVPTCRTHEPLPEVRDRVRAEGWDVCVVVNEARVVLGLLRSAQLDSGETGPVERVMRPGPSTFRPHVSAIEMAEYMVEHDLPSAPVTTSDGVLVGMLRREDALAAVERWHQQHHHDEDDDAGEDG